MTDASFRMELSPEPLPSSDDLATSPFALLLANARALAVTGRLTVRREVKITLLRGLPIHSSSDDADDATEIFLRQSAGLDSRAIEDGLRRARAQSEGLGEALLALGHIDPNQLYAEKQARALADLVRCFKWDAGLVEFEPLSALGPDVLPLALDIVRVFSEGIARHYDRRRLVRELPIADSSRLYRIGSPGDSTPAIGTLEARLVQLAASRPTFGSVVLVVGQPPEELLRRFYVLYCLGLVGFEVESPLIVPTPLPAVRTTPPPAVQTTRLPTTPPPPVDRPSSAPPGVGRIGSRPSIPAVGAGRPLAPTPMPGRISAPTPMPGQISAPPPPADRAPSTAPVPLRPGAGASSTPMPGRSSAPPPREPPLVGSRPAMTPPPGASRFQPTPPPPGRIPSRPALPLATPPSSVPTPAPLRTRTPMPGQVGSRPSMPVPRGEVPAGVRTDSRPTLPPAATAAGVGPKSRRPGGSAHARSVGDYLEEAELARGSRQWDEALLALHHAGELEPDNPAVWAQKALTLLLKDPRLNAKEANQLARDSRKADPGLALPYVAMGMLMEHVGETERAGHLYRMALSRDPSCEDALERLDELERSRVP